MSDTFQVEEQPNTDEVNNNLGSNSGQSKNTEPLINTFKHNLSKEKCVNYFKNNLRGDGNVTYYYKDILIK